MKNFYLCVSERAFNLLTSANYLAEVTLLLVGCRRRAVVLHPVSGYAALSSECLSPAPLGHQLEFAMRLDDKNYTQKCY